MASKIPVQWDQGWLCHTPRALWLQWKWGLGMGRSCQRSLQQSTFPPAWKRTQQAHFLYFFFHQHSAMAWAGQISHCLALPLWALSCFWLLPSLSSLLCSLKDSLAGSGQVQAHGPSAFRVDPAHQSCTGELLRALWGSGVICTPRALLGAHGWDESKEEDMAVLKQLKILSSCHFWRWNSQWQQVSVDGLCLWRCLCAKIRVALCQSWRGEQGRNTAKSLGTADRVILWLKVIKTKQ